jgi:hypothetical protein
MNFVSFIAKWMQNVVDTQDEEGVVSPAVPSVIKDMRDDRLLLSVREIWLLGKSSGFPLKAFRNEKLIAAIGP